MPFGDTAKKLQQVANAAEKLYEKMNDLREQLQDLRDRVEKTSEQIEDIDREQAEQRAILEALAEEQDLDTDAIVAERVGPPESDDADETDGTDETSESGETGESDGSGESDETGETSDASSAGDDAPSEANEVPADSAGDA